MGGMGGVGDMGGMNDFGSVAPTCAGCGAGGADFLCSRCKAARFCGPECQRSAWRRHKVGCQPTPAPPAGPAAPANGRLALTTITNMSCQVGLTGTACGDRAPHTASPFKELDLQVSVGFWDPAALAAIVSIVNFARYRQTEITHGLIAMITATSHITLEITGKLTGHLSSSAGLVVAKVSSGLGGLASSAGCDRAPCMGQRAQRIVAAQGWIEKQLSSEFILDHSSGEGDGLHPKPFGEASYAPWQGGDFIKNGEAQGDQVFCQMKECIPEVVKAMRACVKETAYEELKGNREVVMEDVVQVGNIPLYPYTPIPLIDGPAADGNTENLASLRQAEIRLGRFAMLAAT
eukprot:14668103-Heterocapsa_arctica.AAC.1